MAISLNSEIVTTEVLKVRLELDERSKYPLRIGLIVVSTDLSIESELRKMSNPEDVEFFVNRVAYTSPANPENLRAMASDLTRAASSIVPESRLDGIVYGCTSGTVMIGVEAILERIRAARHGIACTTPITAACKGFEKLGVKRIVLLTPYRDEVNQPMREYLESQGISVVAIASFNLDSDEEIARVPITAIRDAALAVDRADAEGIFISCTTLRAVDAINAIESHLSKPVISSNQALLWDALRLCGYQKQLQGYGYLMQN